jgi:ADP-ribosylglycohydrolase
MSEEHTPSPPLAGFPSPGRFLGCLLGGAVGDALGYPIEFVHSAEEIMRRYGATPPRMLDYTGHGPLISDDTQMTLFTAEGLIRGKERWNAGGICNLTGCVHRAYQRWLLTQGDELVAGEGHMVRSGWLWQQRGLWQRRAPGVTCLSALASGVDGSVENPPNDSKGCGAVMRSAPFGLAAMDREWAFRESRDAAALTHGHPSGFLTAAYFASLVFDVSRGSSLTVAMDAADQLLVSERGHEETAAVIARVRALAGEGPPTANKLEMVGDGWIGEEALGIALLCALTTDGSSPRAVAETLWRSVAHGGDSDSTGSLTGNLLGAMFGVECLPPAWAEVVELRDVVERVARDLHTVFTGDEDVVVNGYPPN